MSERPTNIEHAVVVATLLFCGFGLVFLFDARNVCG
jgi:hypothetical protein